MSLVAVAAAAASSSAQSVGWATEFTPRGVLGYASDSVAFDDGGGTALFVVGRFTAAGDVLDSPLSKWNGANWSPFPSSIEPATTSGGALDHVEVFDSGAGPELYAAGFFETIEGVAASSIARWNSSGWSSIGAAVTSGSAPIAISALSVLDDGAGPALFAGVSHNAPLLSGSSLNRWDGTQWSAYGANLAGTVQDIAVFDFGAGPQVVVAGSALSWGAPGVALAATWDGSNWVSLGAPTNGPANALAVYDDGSGAALYLGAYSNTAWGMVAKWNGAAWQTIAAGANDGSVNDLLVHDDGSGPKLYAAGSFGVINGLSAGHLARWDGVNWSTVGVQGVGLQAASNSTVIGLASTDFGAGPRLVVAGQFDHADQLSAFGVTAWDGAAFESFGDGHGVFGWSSTLAEFQGQLHVGGLIGAFGGVLQASLGRWDGTRWRETIPDLIGWVTSLATFDDGQGERLFVGGGETNTTVGYQAWDGVSVSTLGGIGPGSAYIRAQLRRQDTSGPSLYVAGSFQSIGGVAARNVAKWDGSTWSQVGNLPPNGLVSALAFHDDGSGEKLYAAGGFLKAGGQYVFGIASFDGTNWAPVGNGFDGHVAALKAFDDGSGPQLYAAGSFSTAPPLLASQVARWDGALWRPVGAGLSSGEVLALEVFDDGAGAKLYAGGRFQFSGATPVRRLASWDGATWSEVGGGVNNDVNALLAYDDGSGFGDSLWLAGSFHEVGGVVSAGIARWGKTCGAENYCSSGVTSNGCVSQLSGVGHASATLASAFTLEATNLEGARSGHLFYGVNGAHSSPWGQSSHFLCVKAPTQRTPTQPTNGTAGACDGAMSLDWNAFASSHPSALGQPFSAGQDVWAQGYFRDPAGPKTTALTNGLHFVICP